DGAGVVRLVDAMEHTLARQQRPRFDVALPLGAKRDRELGVRRLFHGHRARRAVLRRPHMAALRPRRTPDVTEAGTVSDTIFFNSGWSAATIPIVHLARPSRMYQAGRSPRRDR